MKNAEPNEASVLRSVSGRSELRRRDEPADLGGFHALGTVLEVKLDRLILLERFEARAFNHRMVDEDIFSSVVGLYEAEPFLIIKPLDLTRGHLKPLLSDVWDG